MSRCELCEICKYTKVQLHPKGTDSPQMYFIGEAPGWEEGEDGTPFIGKAGKYLHNVLDGFGLNINNCRFFNVVRCYPQISDEDKSFRAPNDKEIENCKHNLFEDILSTMPKVIVTLGNVSSRTIIGKDFSSITRCHGKVYKASVGDTEFTVVPLYHPSFLMRQAGNANLRIEFKKDLSLAISICSGKSIKYANDFSDNIEFNDATVICKTYEDFDRYCREEIDNSVTTAYDIETNALEKTSSGFEVVGFSLASRNTRGCYVVLDSLDYEMSEHDKRKVEARLRRILLTKSKVLIYNCMYELPSSLNWLGIEIKNVEDLFVKVKLMMGNADRYEGNGGLKMQCQMNLGIKDWSEDLDKYFELLTDFKNQKDNMRSLLSKYYFGDKLDEIMVMVEDIANNHETFKNQVISYGNVPSELIGKYGGTDSSVLYDLNDFYDRKMNEESEKLGIDLFKGYGYWMKHHIAGYTLERNGAFWNESIAKEVEDWCNKGMIESLKNLIVSPMSENLLKSKLQYNFIQWIKENYLVTILGDMARPKRMCKNSVTVIVNDASESGKKFRDYMSRMSIEPDKKNNQIFKLELGNIMTLAQPFLKEHEGLFEKWYKNYMDNYISEKHTLSEYKCLINPGSTNEEFRNAISEIFITPDIKYAKFYMNLVHIIETPNFSPETYYNDDRKVLELMIKLEASDLQKKDRLNVLVKFLNSSPNFRSRQILRELNGALNFHLETANEGAILEIYELYCMCGLEIDNRESWSENFRWLYNYRMYKKYSKMITTYINGRVGRQNVWYGDKKSFSAGDSLTRGEISYFDNLSNGMSYNLDKNYTTMYRSNFSVCMADSGRWKATMHTLPAGETIKGIFTSRFKGGVIAMPDCSQAEVRVLAAVSGDENLLNAFQQDGMDIHRYVGSQIFTNGDMEAVTKAQRSVAKGAVFGLLYGESVKSFADSFFHGDINEANKVYDYFYNAFPKIKDYVDESHRMYDETGKVTLKMMDRFLNMSALAIQNGDDKDRIYRQCQNMIIQGQTCDLAGMILYNICDYIRKNNMRSKPFCFIHDSIEIDLHPDETFKMFDVLTPLFNDYPMKTFGVPMASDIVFSANMGAEIEFEDFEHDDEYNDVKLTLNGMKDNIDDVDKQWRDVYDVVEVLNEESTGEKYISFSNVFQKKFGITPFFGKTRETIKRRYHIIRKLDG